MSGYNKDNDKVLKLFEMKQEKGSLQFVLFSYKGDAPKLQITRTYNKKDGTIGYATSGRLSKEEVQFLLSINKNILEIMSQNSVGEEKHV